MQGGIFLLAWVTDNLLSDSRKGKDKMTTNEARHAMVERIETIGRQYGHWAGWIDTTGTRFVTLPFTSYGAYDNSCMVERCNVAWFMKHYGKRAGIHLYTGSHYFAAVVVDVEHVSRKTIDDIADYLDVLEYYPCIDDELLSRMEHKAIRATFNADYRFNMPRGLKALAWELVSNHIGDLAIIESGGIVFIDWDRLRIASASLKEDRDRLVLFT